MIVYNLLADTLRDESRLGALKLLKQVLTVGARFRNGLACRPGDLNEDEETGFSDLLVLLSQWGPCDGCAADLDENMAVDFGDLLQLLSTWGPCP